MKCAILYEYVFFFFLFHKSRFGSCSDCQTTFHALGWKICMYKSYHATSGFCSFLFPHICKCIIWNSEETCARSRADLQWRNKNATNENLRWKRLFLILPPIPRSLFGERHRHIFRHPGFWCLWFVEFFPPPWNKSGLKTCLKWNWTFLLFAWIPFHLSWFSIDERGERKEMPEETKRKRKTDKDPRQLHGFIDRCAQDRSVLRGLPPQKFSAVFKSEQWSERLGWGGISYSKVILLSLHSL